MENSHESVNESDLAISTDINAGTMSNYKIVVHTNLYFSTLLTFFEVIVMVADV